MFHKIITIAAGALLLGPVAARATIIDGSFSGTMTDGTDTSGVFNESAGSDLTGDTVTGTFVYDTSLFSQSVSGGTNAATGTGPGALTVTLTINGISHTFNDSANSSLFLDSTSTSEVTYQSDASSAGGGTTINDTFELDVIDPSTPFVASTNLDQSFSTTNPDSTTGTFLINDGGPTLQAGGDFTLGTLTQAPATAAPEPMSLALLTVGLGGLGAVRRRRAVAR